MKRWLSFIVLAAVTAGIVYYTVTVLEEQRSASDSAIDQAGEPLVPGFYDTLNDTAAIKGLSAGEGYEIKREGDAWIIPSKAGYAADGNAVRQLLIGVAGLKRVEPKTANPELYERIGLTDPANEDSDATRLTASDANGGTLFDIVFGERKFAKGDDTLSEIYVRLGDDPQTWLVRGKLPEATDVDGWVDSQLIEIDRGRVRKAVVVHADGDAVTAARDATDTADFSYVELPEGRELEQQWHVNDIANALASLEFDDVANTDAELEGAEPLLTATMETFDGLRVILDGQSVGESVVGTLRAEAFEPEEAGEGDKTAETDADSAAVDVAAEVETLNARWSGWRYTLPKFKADYLKRREADLVKAPEAEATSEANEAAPSAADLGLPPVFDLKPPE